MGSAFISALADQITKVEGSYAPGAPGFPSGSIAWRNNNPGNLRSAPSSFCQINPPAAAGYADFCDPATGRAALVNDVTAKVNRGLTLTQFLNVYAPAGDGNDPTSYAATVAAGLQIDPGIPLINYVNGSNVPGDGSTAAAQSDDSSNNLVSDVSSAGSSFDVVGWWASLDPVMQGALLGGGTLLLAAVLE